MLSILGDTITIPTDFQLLFALQASRGDDVYGEDASTTALESRIARLTGKEAAMFACSGTMTNRKSPLSRTFSTHEATEHYYLELGPVGLMMLVRTCHSDTYEAASS